MSVEFLFPDKQEAKITVHRRRWFGLAKPKTVTYRGSGTVWHDYATGKRASSSMEAYLADLWTFARWRAEGS